MLSKPTALLRGRVLSAEGTATQSQCWASLRDQKHNSNTLQRPFPAVVESASGLEFPVIGNVTWLRLLGTVTCSQMPTKQLEHPAQEEKLLAGPYNSRSYVSGTQQMVQESPLTENDFHQSLEPETMIIKLKKRLKNSFPNSAELISYSLS